MVVGQGDERRHYSVLLCPSPFPMVSSTSDEEYQDKPSDRRLRKRRRLRYYSRAAESDSDADEQSPEEPPDRKSVV